jgi:hypothetical protein
MSAGVRCKPAFFLLVMGVGPVVGRQIAPAFGRLLSDRQTAVSLARACRYSLEQPNALR